MPELAPGVVRIPTSKRDNAFLVDGEDGLTLVDVGWASAPRQIAAALETLGHALTDIRRVVLTHAHPDHVKGAAELKARTGAKVLLHQADAAWLQSGRVPPQGRSGAFGRLIDKAPLLHWAPVTPDILLTGGEEIDGLRVIHTPGHTPGHIALHHEPSNTLLVGDAIFNRGPELTLGPPALAADPELRPGSLARLPTDVTSVGLAHGDPLRGKDLDRYRTLIGQ
jgi:glyoxylase-like metal-dependent hydrolase (beta-lactamase superfamily II)